MLRTVFVMAAALLVLAAAQDLDAKPQEETKPSPLTAIQLPSESIFRAARTAVRAARALADNMPTSFSLSNNMVQTLAVAGAVVVGLIGSVGILAAILPLFGFRMCYLFGTCDASYAHAFLAPTAYDAYAYSQPVYASAAYAKSYDGATNELPYSYDAYPQHAAQVAAAYPTSNSVAANAYQKSVALYRSLEYVGPILKMLSNAYDKYNHPGQAKAVVEAAKTTVSSAPAEIQAE